ncbi:hypothetical protein PYW08_015416 [Mythimna loreyi]|uniref:Uncharacterized protein n=1 Tax=Mythimna loreyi TaxID=667449 RepID=A0ACC2R0R2_9NEOP|nr:hypothetical protein PYW08_015416 [Mythimna loreyi]
MSETANSEAASESEKPVQNDGVQFPPFPDPKDEDFDDDIAEEERVHYKTVFKDLNTIKDMRLHCTACDRHLGCSARNEVRMRAHPMLRTLVCHNCHVFYNSGEFEKGDDGSELYCRWCGQGGQVYCCSDCPHVFCAKCIKRNLGNPKIKEIENADDWKCFKCNSKCLWDLRALCWAVLRFCDLKNKMAYQCQDPQLKEAYKKDCSIDYSECCKNKSTRRSSKMETKKKEIKKEPDVKPTIDAKTAANNIISKIPSTIQVKKFAAVNVDDIKQDKKAQKRSSSPKNKAIFVKNPISIAPCAKVLNPVNVPPLKKMRLPSSPMIAPLRFINEKKQNNISTYARIRPKPPQLPMSIGNCSFNGFNTSSSYGANLYNSIADNINLSLESLTQGLDMSAVASLAQNNQDDDVVCTPDFPLEPVCEVTEDNDDDVQCITPGPVAPPKITNPPPLVPRSTNTSVAEITSDNIVQMTDNDVTVNVSTGGLKFRVDPQTLSSNKMYRLPDGRIFAINANPNMPGGYSATIVAVTEPTGKSTAPKGATYAAKLSAVTTSPAATLKTNRNVPRILKRSTPKPVKTAKTSETPTRDCDLNVPVEWYRYNLIDAVDALEYALSRLHKLKKEATTVYLRTRTVNEMRNLHRTLERLLGTSASRFGEIRENLNKGLKQYVLRKSGGENSEDDDDVEILPDMEDNDDPIFIDENSVESTMNGSESHEVDLTGAGSSEYNDSGENTKDKSDIDPLNTSVNDNDISTHGDVLAVISHNKTLDDAAANQITNQARNNEDKPESDNVEDNQTERKDDVTESDIIKKEIDKKNVENKTENNEDKIESDININECTTNGQLSKNETEKEVKEEENIKDMEVDTDPNENDTKTQKNEATKVKSDNVPVTPPCDDLKCNETADEVNDVMAEPSQEKTAKKEESEDSMINKDINDKSDSQDSDDKLRDTEMSEEMIETLLKDDNVGDESASNLKSMDVSEVLQET